MPRIGCRVSIQRFADEFGNGRKSALPLQKEFYCAFIGSIEYNAQTAATAQCHASQLQAGEGFQIWSVKG